MKKISIQEGLNELASELINRGYEIVENNSDAYIYMADGYNMSNLSNINSDRETLLINATDKTIDQIEDILNKGYYTPLF
ncbi:MAG: YkuS family protein [Senegalia sp. (in: firmicutes)]|uniref:YkuS family protein n=1 Tax=Senegalia sp. (in: firmicutes) TaxID=1924098 RepID=UPI003F9C7E4E